MEKSDIKHTHIQAVKSLYTDMRSCVKVGNRLSESFPVTKGLRQGCAIAPTLFKIYLNAVLELWRRTCEPMGVSIGDNKLYTLHFADDQVIVAEDRDDIQYMLRKLDEEYLKWGLTINALKTEYVNVGGIEPMDLGLDRGSIKGVNSYKYLGVTFTKDGVNDMEINKRIGQGKYITRQLHPVLWNTHISNATKIRIYKTVVESIVTYGAETWDINEKQKSRLLAMEMAYWRRCCGVTLRDRVKNTDIRQRMGIDTSIADTVEAKILRWYGHVCRMENERWPKKMLQWVPHQRRRKGRPRRTWRNNVEDAMQKRNLQEGDWTDRNRWKLGCGTRL